MTKEELITNQQLVIEEFKNSEKRTKQTARKLYGELYSIGAPLNDNKLQFNQEQLKWLLELSEIIDEL